MKDLYFKQSKICCISDIHIGVHQNNSSWHKVLLDWSDWLYKEFTNLSGRAFLLWVQKWCNLKGYTLDKRRDSYRYFVMMKNNIVLANFFPLKALLYRYNKLM